jgi:sentrin-specific protease 1
MEMYQQQIMQRMGRAKFLRIFRQGEILQSRPSVPSHDEAAAARLDEVIERKEAELPSKKRTDEIIAAKEREDREREARESAMKLMRPLTAEERNVVAGATEGIGPPAEIVASQDADSVQRGSMQSLRPGQWLNDEVINYFLKNCLARRDEMLCAREPGRRRSHFFNSFFVQTMFDEKNNDPRLRGRYNYKNVRRWSKKVPGKDIFELKYILCPINLDNMHWTSAVIFMEDKRIQYYDSMGGTDRAKLEGLLEYVKDEYRAKNGKDMDTSEWELVSCRRDTPRQRNGELHLSV